MKNLYAAVVLAIIVFFLSSCGENEVISSAISTQSMIEISSVVSQPAEPKEIIKVFTKEEYDVLTDDGLNAVKFPFPQEFKQVNEGEEVKVRIEDFAFTLVFTKDSTSNQNLLEGFKLKEVYFGYILAKESETEDIIISATTDKSKVLISQGDEYIACYGNPRSYLKKNEDIDRLFCADKEICYVKEDGNIVEIGKIEDDDNEYKSTLTARLNTEEKIVTITQEPYKLSDGSLTCSVNSEREHESYINAKGMLDTYFILRNDSLEDYQTNVVMNDLGVSYLLDIERQFPAKLYVNGKLLCEPDDIKLKEVNSDRGVEVTKKGDKMIIFVCSLAEGVLYYDSVVWIFVDNSFAKIEAMDEFAQNPDVFTIDEEGSFRYRKLASGMKRDYVAYTEGIYEYDTLEEYIDELEWYFGDEMPDVDAPHYEYGEIVIEDGEAVCKPTHTRSIRELFEEKDG